MSLGDILKQSLYEIIPNGFEEEEIAFIKAKKEFSEEDKKRIQEYQEKVFAPIVYQEFTAEELYSKFESNPKIIIDENNRKAIKILSLYFTNDKRFEQLGGSLNKGLMLRGGVGIGKTFLMNIFRSNQKQIFSVKNCGEIASKFNIEGRQILSDYSTKKPCAPSQLNFGQSESGICFDDLGCEKEGIYYADKVEIMATILEMRYTRSLHGMTHITTNILASDIELKYGQRVRSRMREMFNVIDFPETATDRRK